jgi:modulator of FtsH protease HflK
MEQNYQRIGIINWLTLLVAAAISLVLARFADTTAGLAATVFLGLGFLVAAVSYFQMRLEERERLEGLEFEELQKARAEAALFAGADSFPARRSRDQFERFFVPGFTVLLLLLQGVTLYSFWRWLPSAPPPGASQAAISMALYALVGLVLFLLGKYAAGVARLERQRLLRPGAGYLLLGSLACFLVATTEAAVWFKVPQADRYLTWIFLAVLGFVTIETLFGLVLEVYRPRVRGQSTRVLYESRLIGLLGQPGGLITTAAQALDYQFGFKVSETWVYKFLEKALSWIILLQLGALFFSTTFVIVEPDEQALLERFGSPVAGREVLEPGLHFKWPWPIDQAYRHPTRRIQNFIIGVIPDDELEKERVVLWTRPHYKEEFNLLVASREASMTPTDGPAAEKPPPPANLLAASIPVHFEITNLVAWTYNHRDAAQLLEDYANREVIRYLVSVDFERIMSFDRRRAGEILRERIQAQANRIDLGVRIVYIGLQNIHPPIGTKMVQVAAAFEQVVGSMHQKETNILGALAYEASRLPAAQAEATNLIARASSQRTLKVATAEAEADRFQNQLAAFRASPSVYKQRTHLETLARTLSPLRKYVIGATNTTEVITLNFEDRLRSDLASGVILPSDVFRTNNPANP